MSLQLFIVHAAPKSSRIESLILSPAINWSKNIILTDLNIAKEHNGARNENGLLGAIISFLLKNAFYSTHFIVSMKALCHDKCQRVIYLLTNKPKITVLVEHRHAPSTKFLYI